jgi:hypothetical protein
MTPYRKNAFNLTFILPCLKKLGKEKCLIEYETYGENSHNYECDREKYRKNVHDILGK